MKNTLRIFLAFMLLMGFSVPMTKVMADNVDGKKARKVAAYFMSAQFGSKSITPSSLEQVYEIPNIVKGIPALYAFNVADDRGFVIVSGSDCISPIVAYSTDGPLDPNNIPPAMLWWLGEQANVIAYCQNEDLEPADAAIESWNVLEEERLPYFGKDSKANPIRLLETKWNQNYPYNTLCPPVTNGTSDVRGRAYVGCVATAMSQIIRYWKYPRQGFGSHSYHVTENAAGLDTVLSVNFGASYYNYDKMPIQITEDSSSDVIYEISKLGYHCGVAVEMGYSGDGSGVPSNSPLVPDAFKDYFKYVPDSIQLLRRDSYMFRNDNRATNPNDLDTEWVNIIVNEIVHSRPVYYGGFSPDGGQDAGHAFVCDGWNDKTKALHFNWGWGGNGDSWCNVYTGQLKPSRGPRAGEAYNFYQNNRIVIGIMPPQDSIHLETESIQVTDNPFVGAIYPNPASSQVTISYELNGTNNEMLQVFDAAGRMVMQTEVSPVGTQISISVADLHPGIYFCRLNGYTQKFVVK